ncbi:type II toxin-antitoxin system VapB family antitoxin [Candidatus Poribacteria bacterium]|nr:type II toxin-antitoxin system VapB family antitoxin [Candidatus Poribacteria bacterium]
MRATLNIPDDLLLEVQKIAGEKSKTKAIIIAIQDFIKRKKLEKLLMLKGKIEIDYNWEKEEKMELNEQKKRMKYLES